MIFQGGIQTPCPPPLWIRPWHASCLKCSFQRVVIIGLKVGLDYNSWYACLPLIRHAERSSGSKLQTLIAGRKSRERERDTARCLHTNLLFWLGFLEYQNAMFGQSINLVTTASDEDPKPKLIVRIGFCTAQSDIPRY